MVSVNDPVNGPTPVHIQSALIDSVKRKDVESGMREGDVLGRAPGGAGGRMAGDFVQNAVHTSMKLPKKINKNMKTLKIKTKQVVLSGILVI